jgi:HD-like signal output (HDOD) protein
MFSQLWRRLTGGEDARTAAEVPAAVPAVAAPAPANCAPSAEATAPLESAPLSTEASLHRSLHWRAKVLLDGASREALSSDGPELVAGLRNANEMVIRQPPLAAQQALLVARDPDSPIAKVTLLFENDPMLAQALLRQANSIYYRRDGTPCTSLNTGVQRVGMKGVQGVLMASLVQQLLCRPGGLYDALVQNVWSHMQRTAPIARAIAPAFGLDGETLYSLALLHDVGKLVVFDHLSRLRHDHRREIRMPEPFFRQLLFHLHEPIGGLAALRWDMGAEAAHAIAEHHRRPAPEKPDPLTECLYVAERVELAHSNFTKLDWESIWDEGAITGDVLAVQDRVRQLEE